MKHKTYTKINSLYQRDKDNKNRIMLGEYSRQEFEYLKDALWRAYIKIDGTCMSYYWDGHTMEIHGKTENAQIPKPLQAKMESLVTPEMLAEVFPIKYDENGNEIPFQVIIYGEGYGAGIQSGGGYIKNGVNFRVFDVLYDDLWLEPDSVDDICGKLHLESVVPYGIMTISEAENFVINGFIDPIAEDKTLIAEGLVLRPLVQLFNRKGERIMVKIKHCDYKHLKEV